MQKDIPLISEIITLFKKEPKLAILMSGKGSNAEAILRNRQHYPNLKFRLIVTDNPKSNAEDIANRWGLQYLCIAGSIETGQARQNYFQRIADQLKRHEIEGLVYAGFMKIAPDFFVSQFPGINSHPADLSILDENCQPLYRGMHVIRMAIERNERNISSTVHVVDSHVDSGQPIVISQPLAIDIFEPKELHETLKYRREHATYCYALHCLSKGLLSEKELPLKLTKTILKEEDMDTYFAKNLLEKIEEEHPLDLMFEAQDKSARVGFDFDHIDLVMNKVKEEVAELHDAFKTRESNWNHFEEEIGDCFFSLVNLCRHAKSEQNDLLKKNVNKYLQRCLYIETALEKQNKKWTDVSLNEIYALWRESKGAEACLS